MPCQSGRSIGTLAASIALVAGTPACVAASASWAHQAGSVSSNGAVTVRSLSGGTYSATQNPTGAVAKANQVAATQPPTVIIQATGSGLPFNYKDDCYILSIAGYSSEKSMAAGKLDASNNFTGVLAHVDGGTNSSAAIMSILTGGAFPGGATYSSFVKWCGSDAACARQQSVTQTTIGSYHGASGFPVVAVSSMPTASVTKCYL